MGSRSADVRDTITATGGCGSGMDRHNTAIRRRTQRFCAAFIALATMTTAAWAQPSTPPDPAAVAMNAGKNTEVIVALAKVLRERFAFPDRAVVVAGEIEALEKAGTFRNAGTAADLLALIDERITPLVNDQHFRARYMGPEFVAGFSEAPPSAEAIAAFNEEVRLRGGEIPEVRWLPGNVGYLRIGMFMNAEASVEKLAAAMTMLVDTGALIVDVRGSPGGEPAGVANVIGHFVSKRTPTVRTQIGSDESTAHTFHAEPRTPQFVDKPLYVLTDGNTGSGAEEFAYDLQAMGRATLVGETTSGAATPGGFRPLAHGFVAFIPMQIVANTITGTNWEGVGVIPDVKVPAAESLMRAHRLALEAILKTAQGVDRDIAQEGLASLEPSPQP